MFLLDRQGSYQFWNGVWNSQKNYSTLFSNFFFMDNIILTFLKGKNSVHYYFLKKNEELALHFEKNDLVYDETFNLLNNIFQKKKNLKKYFYLFGTTWVFKYQSWYIICISTYKPLKKKIYKFSNSEQILNFFELKKTTFEKI